MSTALVVEKKRPPRADYDPSAMVIRWGFNPVQRDKNLNARECGISIVPFAKFFPVESRDQKVENHSTDSTQPNEIWKVQKAAEAQSYIEESLSGTGVQEGLDWGCRFGFHNEEDAGKMIVLDAVLVPLLSTIREICRDHNLECPVSNVCEGTDETDFYPREECPTCWTAWLQSAACTEYMQFVVQNGMEINERDPDTGILETRTVRPTVKEFENARQMMLESFRTGLNSIREQWREVASEDERGTRKKITRDQHANRKDIHETKPQDRQIALMQQFAKNIPAAQALPAAAADNPHTQALLEQLVASQTQMQNLVAQLALQNQNLMASANPMPEPVTEIKQPIKKGAKENKENE